MGVVDDIAKQVGVSKWTVLRALESDREYCHGPAKKRVAEIRRIADELNYRPNAAAAAVAKGRFDALGLLIPYTRSGIHLPFRLVRGIMERANDHHMHITLDQVPTEQLTDSTYMPTILKKLAVDGLLLNFIGTEDDTMVKLINSLKIPSIWINNRRDTDSAFPDDRHGGVLATRHMRKFGHERIAYINVTRHKHYSTQERRQGYEEAMRADGLEPNVLLFPSDSTADELIADFAQVLQSDKRPTAFIAYSLEVAVTAMMAASKLGIHIPSDLSILCFGTRVGQIGSTRITTIVPMIGKTGAAAVDMLLKKIKNPTVMLPSERIQYEEPEGDSCAPAPA